MTFSSSHFSCDFFSQIYFYFSTEFADFFVCRLLNQLFEINAVLYNILEPWKHVIANNYRKVYLFYREYSFSYVELKYFINLEIIKQDIIMQVESYEQMNCQLIAIKLCWLYCSSFLQQFMSVCVSYKLFDFKRALQMAPESSIFFHQAKIFLIYV